MLILVTVAVVAITVGPSCLHGAPAGSEKPTGPTGAARLGSADGRIAAGVLDAPVVQAVIAALGAAAFVLLRLAVVAKDDVTRFVMAGSDFVDRARAPAGLHVFAGTGYDGQFHYRLALDPADLSRTAFGITMDSFFRLQRIGYPLLSWLAAVGQHPLVPDAEIAVNVMALAGLAWLGAVIARDAGRHCGWGLLVAGYWGFVFSIARDLPEVVGSCFLVAGLVALRRERPVLGGVLFAGAVLTIETTLDVVLAVALLSLVPLLRRHRRPSRQDAAWIIPGVAFAGWQLVCWAATGTLPLRADSGANLSWPFVNALGALAHYLGALPSVGSVIWLGELGALALVNGSGRLGTAPVPDPPLGKARLGDRPPRRRVARPRDLLRRGGLPRLRGPLRALGRRPARLPGQVVGAGGDRGGGVAGDVRPPGRLAVTAPQCHGVGGWRKGRCCHVGRGTGTVLSGLLNAREIGLVGHSDGGGVSLTVAADTCCRYGGIAALVTLSVRVRRLRHRPVLRRTHPAPARRTG